jgi:DNA-binding XRE family transcriptional regulator
MAPMAKRNWSGKDLKRIRERNELTQEQLGKLWMMDRPTIGRVEANPSPTKSIQMLIKIFDKHGKKLFEEL